MKRRLSALAAAAGLLVAASVTPALAHHPEVTDEGGTSTSAYKYEGLETKLDRDWAVTASGTGKGKGSAPSTFAPCIDGMAADFFPCDGVDLLSHVSHNELGTIFVNDIWGWTDPSSKKDYALVGASNGTVFVNISDGKRPQVLGILPTASTVGGSSWRDIKVYEDHAYVVSEHTNHGVQVFDLTRLRDWDGTYTTYDVDARYTGHGSAHNININEDTGYLYSVGAGPFSSGGLPNTVTVDAPSSAAGEYAATGAAFGPPTTVGGLTGAFAVVNDGSAAPAEGCGPLVGFPAGAIAIADRGTCPFTQKVANAQAAGASAVVIANNSPASPITLGGSDASITIPSVMVSQADGFTIKAGLPATGGITANDPPAVCGTGLHMIDINEPKNPTYAGCFDGHGYIHDTQCIVYDGPDTDYTGREICFNSNATTSGPGGLHRVAIVDVTDKSNPISIAREGYSNDAYSHQGWLTPDRRFFLHGDELDEQRRGINTTTRVWDVSDLDNIEMIQAFENDTTSIDHNIYTQGRYAYASNYTSGLRVYDTRDLSTGGLSEVAFFDLYPENDNATFEGGTWSNYAYFGQKGLVAASSIDRGLFILQPKLSRQGN
ncbi:choice-of-anchor B family protein [Ornithinimicrobium cerasi]|uniref:Choice-of-anchor B domain-containing protein n=1 Tax=Ornithinimicrobium cerasi TaxID=2248773 RepID=A0A285VUK2_9MICO|nr:choice-of-anchor B family protein [Ornithinimicrobium cerasi]SOC56311.1 choice-of-anchor B domain-containing protein [Ornithinimicrobium cerasi]